MEFFADLEKGEIVLKELINRDVYFATTSKEPAIVFRGQKLCAMRPKILNKQTKRGLSCSLSPPKRNGLAWQVCSATSCHLEEKRSNMRFTSRTNDHCIW